MQESDNSKCDVTRDTCLGIVPFIDKREDCSRKCNNTELCADVTFNNGSQISILILGKPSKKKLHIIGHMAN